MPTPSTRPRRRPFGEVESPRPSRTSRVRTRTAYRADEAEAKVRLRAVREKAAREKLRTDAQRARTSAAQAKAASTRRPPMTTGTATRSEVRAVRADQRPPASGPKGRRPAPGKVPGAGIGHKLVGLGSRNPHRTLVAETLTVALVVTVAELADGHSPNPGAYVAPFAIYLVLGIASEFGDGPAKVSAALGLLVLVGVIFARYRQVTRALDVASSPSTAAGLGTPTTTTPSLLRR
jgi:hypothetical protein